MSSSDENAIVTEPAPGVRAPIAQVQIKGGDRVHPGEYREIFAAVGWVPPDQDDEVIAAALRATWNVTARTADSKLVGLARLLDDGVMYASLWDLLVDPAWRRQGIGRALFTAAMERTAGRRLVSLIATAAGAPLYREAGFVEHDARSTAMFIRS